MVKRLSVLINPKIVDGLLFILNAPTSFMHTGLFASLIDN